MNRISAILWMMLLLAHHNLAANKGEERMPTNQQSEKIGIRANSNKVQVPFELYHNHVFLQVAIKEKCLRLAFDTGMPMDGAVLFATPGVSELNLQYVDQTMVGGAGGEPAAADVATGVTFELNGLKLANQTVLVMRNNPFPGDLIGEFDGVFGYTLLSRFAVNLDFDRMILTLVEPDKFRHNDAGFELPITLEHGYPFITCSAEMAGGAIIPLQLIVDLGASHALALDTQSHKDITKPDNALEFRIGKGIGGDVYGFIGRIRKLHLGPFTLSNVVTSFSFGPLAKCAQLEKAKHGNLGTNLLRRFNVTFDYTNNKMILEPNRHFDEPFEFNMTGIQFTRNNDGTFIIDRIVPNSPASESGVKAGDLVIAINNRPANQFNYHDLSLLLEKEGAEVAFTISRENEKIAVNLRLRRLI